MFFHHRILCFHGLLLLFFTGVSTTGWKPIVPPSNYYVTMPMTCVSDCGDQKTAARGSDAVVSRGAESEIHAKHVWSKPGPPLGGPNLRGKTIEMTVTRDKKDLIQPGQSLKYVYHPTNVAFYPVQEIERRKPVGPTLVSYQDIFKKSPVNYYNFKTIPSKPVKTLYYGEPDILKTKISNDVKFLPANVHQVGDELKILIQPSEETDLKSYRPLPDYHYDEHCSMHKVSFQQNLYYQYVQYKTRMPELKEFTICLWFRLHNHSLDHSFFSYSSKPHHKDIYMWVSNLEDPGLFYMKVLGQTIFRLNYPMKLYKWYHTCQSWNGHTGEWQVWVDSHRIARGFHNLLVGHKIPGKGIVISGQEQPNTGKNFQEIPYRYGSSKGLQGEITMLQMYKVALTAGKANNDHRHHHSHHTSTTPEPPEEESTEEMPPTTEHPLLENGQLKTHVNILELVETLKTKGHIEGLEHHDHHGHHELPGDYEAFPQPLSLSYQGPIASSFIHHGDGDYALPEHTIFKREDKNNTAASKIQIRRRLEKDEDSQEESSSSTEQSFNERQARQTKVKVIQDVLHPVKVEKVKFPAGNDTSDESVENLSSEEDESTSSSEEETFTPRGIRRGRARRHHAHSTIVLTGRSKPQTPTVVRTVVKKRRPEPKTIIKKMVQDKKKEPTKRFLLLADPYSNYGDLNVLGHMHYSPLTSYPQGYDPLPQIGQRPEDVDDNPLNAPISSEEDSDDSPTQHELAENEVKRIMLMCSGCHVDPFRKVAVISWRSTPKKIFSGALLLKAKSECENF